MVSVRVNALNSPQVRLRMVCNHPYLLQHIYSEEHYAIDENIVRASGKFELLDRMLPKFRAAGHRVCKYHVTTFPFSLFITSICGPGVRVFIGILIFDPPLFFLIFSMDYSCVLDLLKEFFSFSNFDVQILIFCTMTQLMDLLGAYLEYRGTSYLRLDGSTHDRGDVVDLWNAENSPYWLFMLSTKV